MTRRLHIMLSNRHKRVAQSKNLAGTCKVFHLLGWQKALEHLRVAHGYDTLDISLAFTFGELWELHKSLGKPMRVGDGE